MAAHEQDFAVAAALEAAAPPLRLLVATNHLFGCTGSELTAFTLARQLLARGQQVAVWAPHVNQTFAATFREAGLRVIGSPAEIDPDTLDAAYCQHNVVALELRARCPRLPIVLASLGVLPALEQPPCVETGIARHLAISEEVRDNLLARGIAPGRIEIFRNVVDGSLFTPRAPLAERPRRALIYSYKIDPARRAVIEAACRRLGIACRWAGRRPGELAQGELPALLNQTDVVVSLGRGAIEAMLCGRVPLVYDCHGGDGLVGPDDLDEIAKHNFSGRRHRREYDEEGLVRELERYDAAWGPRLRELALERFDAGRSATRLLSLLRAAATTPPAAVDPLVAPIAGSLAEAREYAAQAARHNQGTAPRRAGGEVANVAPPATAARNSFEPVAALGGPATSCPAQAEATASRPPAAELEAVARVIAFHLPQFHPIPENDAWWGPGFTEWTNVARARPAFPGHYQPQLPGELGFYDLRLPETLEAQARLAREHGVAAFCFYHYWFGGKRLLEKPVETLLATGRPDFPFCLCWANESWTRAWDGASGEVLVGEEYSAADDREHIRYLIPFLRDPRYVRIGERPLLLVYRASRLPDAGATAVIWREEAAAAGLDGLHLCAVESFVEERVDPSRLGFDAAVEFQPDWANLGDPLAHPVFGRRRVFDYGDFSRRQIGKSEVPYRRYPCVTPGWDNSARRPDDALVLVNASAPLYADWVAAAARRLAPLPPDERLLFVNAWNEWGEGCHLEPDMVTGRAQLEATRRGLERAWAASRGSLERALEFVHGFRPDDGGWRWLDREGVVRLRGGGPAAGGVVLWIARRSLATYREVAPTVELWAEGRKAAEVVLDAAHPAVPVTLKLAATQAVDLTLRAPCGEPGDTPAFAVRGELALV